MSNDTRVITLTEFLLARIAEDEQVARTAAIGSEAWRLGEFDETVLWWPPSSPEKIEWNRVHVGEEAAAEHAQWHGQTIESVGDKIAPHIARHDPARVLAECKARRRIVDRLQHTAPDHWAYDSLLDLAEVYADHPDYDEAWRP